VFCGCENGIELIFFVNVHADVVVSLGDIFRNSVCFHYGKFSDEICFTRTVVCVVFLARNLFLISLRFCKRKTSKIDKSLLSLRVVGRPSVRL